MVRALLTGGTAWLAIVVALNAVVGLAYYLRVAVTLFAAGPDGPRPRVPWAVAVALGALTAVALLVGIAPQLVLGAADLTFQR